jgi:reverse gyrase
MKPGRSFVSRGQKYGCVDSFERERPAAWVRLYTLISKCADCGRQFTCTASQGQRRRKYL